MAQLIKLEDYVSRYETDIYQYPTQFIRLKKNHWKKINQLFQQGKLESEDQEEGIEEPPKKGLKRFFSKKPKDSVKEEVSLRSEVISRSPSLPQTTLELKQYFLDGLVPFQLKWASTTLREKSFVDAEYEQDPMLKYFLQRFPDTYFIMYRPIVEMKKAKMEAENILIGPFGIEIIHYLEIPNANAVYPSNENSWFVEQNGVRSKILSPLFSLKRTETFVRSVLQKHDIDFPFRKIVLAPDLSFSDVQEPYQTDYIGIEKYSSWFEQKRQVDSPLKHSQLKVADALLSHSRTTSVKRPEWDFEKNPFEE